MAAPQGINGSTLGNGKIMRIVRKLLFIALAMLAGCRVISFCQTTYNPKLALGCHLAPLTHVVTHKGFLARAIIRRLLPILFSRYHRVCGLPDSARLRRGRAQPLSRGLLQRSRDRINQLERLKPYFLKPWPPK